MTVVRTFITFGSHPEMQHDWIAPRMHEGYVVIEAPTRIAGEKIADVLFGHHGWAFSYDEQHMEESNHRAGYYPAGELARMAWIDTTRQLQIFNAIEDTYDKADGDSNDAEIRSLQEARDMLADIIQWEPEPEPRTETPSESSRAQSGEY